MSHPGGPSQSKSTQATCRLCDATVTRTFVNLGKSPLCQTVLTEAQLDLMEPFYPLHALVCDSCHLVQLKEYVAADGIFTDEYPYFSSFSSSWVAHAKAYCEMIAQRRRLGPDSFVVELACNDGYLLQHFPKLGVANVVGVEPCGNVALAANDKGVATIVDFFGATLAKKIVEERGRADLVLGNNVLAHVPDLKDFVSGVALLLKPNGVATFEFPHLQRLVEENQFDTIYHEHFCYFSAIAIDEIARRHGLRFVDVEELPTHGGSLRVYLVRDEAPDVRTPAVDALIARETALGMKQGAYYDAFDRRVTQTKRTLLSTLIALKDAGKSICAYGAPGKGMTLLNYCGIGTDFIDFAVDRNPAKQHYMPGTHIPILPVEEIAKAQPDYVLILPWNLKTEIMDQMRAIGAWGGKFIVPIPEAKIVSAE